MKRSSVIALLLAIFLNALFFKFLNFNDELQGTIQITKSEIVPNETLRFHLIGDFGLLTPNLNFPILPVQVVANSMNYFAKQNPISMIFTAGDNFYYYLNSYFSDTVFKVMENIFNQDYINKVPWYFTYGNHDCSYNDYFGAYLEKLYKNIYMPLGSWNMTIPIKNGKVSFTVLSCIFQCFGNVENEATYEECLESKSRFTSKNEYQWLEDHLKFINNDQSVIWNIVVIHYPIFSISEIDADEENLKQKLLPLLVKYNVDVVLSGHNHNMQYFTMKKNQTYIAQNQSDLCVNDFIVCGNKKINCIDQFTHCENSNVNCSEKLTWADNNIFPNNKRLSTYKKGEELHQIIMGASGANLDNLCLHLQSPMTEMAFGLSDYGFSEIEISETKMEIKYIHANSSTVVFESRILI